MPVVPITRRDPLAIPDWAKPSETQFAMAAAEIAAAAEHERDVLKDFREQDLQPVHQFMKDYVEAQRNITEDTKTIRKPELEPWEAETIPGRRIP